MATSQPPLERPLASDARIINTDDKSGITTPDEDHVASEKSPPNGPAVPSTSAEQAEDVAPEAERTNLETFLIVFTLAFALFLAALDSTIVTTTIPTIAADFQSSAGYVWIGSAYLLGNAAFVPTWGKVSDIFGRKPVLLAAVSVFWVGSLVCAVSNSMGMLIAGRAIQGVGGGGTLVLPNICISDLFSIRKRGMYFGVFGMVWALASAVGPVLGGAFTNKVSWRWCFYINLPIGGLGFAVLFFVLKLHNPRTPMMQGLAAIDWTGNILIIGGTLMMLFGLELGGVQYPWKSATIICLVVFGVTTIGLFGVYEAKVAKFPVMPGRLFRHGTSIAAYSVAIMHSLTVISGNYWLPLYFQSVLGANSLLSGAYLLPFIISLSITSAGTGIFIKKTGKYKVPATVGLFLSTLGFGLFTYLGDRAHWDRIIIFQLITGMGIGPNFQAPLIALQTNVEPRDISAATSSLAFARQIGTATAVIIGGAIFNNVMQQQQPTLVEELGPELAAQFTGSSAASNVERVAMLPGDQGQVVRTAYWNALQKMYIAYTCFSFLGFLINFFVKQITLSKEHTEHKTGLLSLKAEHATTTTTKNPC